MDKNNIKNIIERRMKKKDRIFGDIWFYEEIPYKMKKRKDCSILNKLLLDGYYIPSKQEDAEKVIDIYNGIKCKDVKRIFDYRIDISMDEIKLMDEYLYCELPRFDENYIEIPKCIKEIFQHNCITNIYEAFDKGPSHIKAEHIIRPFLKCYKEKLECEKYEYSGERKYE